MARSTSWPASGSRSRTRCRSSSRRLRRPRRGDRDPMTAATRDRRHRPDPRAVRSSAIAIVSTVVVFGVVGWIVVHAPGWPEVQTSFLNGKVFWESLPGLLNAFVVNIQLFLIAEVFVLA